MNQWLFTCCNTGLQFLALLAHDNIITVIAFNFMLVFIILGYCVIITLAIYFYNSILLLLFQGVYSIQNATRNREQVSSHSPLVVSECHKNSGGEANVTLTSEPNSVASKTPTEFAYVNAPVSQSGQVLSHDLPAWEEKSTFDGGVYLEPRKIAQSRRKENC